MLKSSLCDYSDLYILASRTIKLTGEGDNYTEKRADERSKRVIFKNCAPFTDCISEINNTQIDSAKVIDIVISMYNVIKYNNNYSKTSESLWWYYRLKANDNIANYKSFRRKIKTTGNTLDADSEKYCNSTPIQLRIIQNCLNNQNLVLKEQLTGININQIF